MTKMSKSVRLFCSLVIIWLVGACSGNASTTISKPLKIEWTLWQGDYTLLVANKMGYFKKHGVSVEPVRYETVSQAIPDLAGAKLDGGLFTMSDTLLASNLADLKAVLVSDAGAQYTIVASPDIQTVNDLRGKRIGVNVHTSSEIFVSDMLKSKRMTANDVTYVEMSPDQISQSIPGQIDAGLVWEPYTSQALKQGKVVVYQSANSSQLIPRLVVFRKTVVDERPQDIRAFLLAWEEAVQYRLSHPQESLAIISKATGLSDSDLKATGDIKLFTISDNVNLFDNTAGTDPSSIYYIAGFNRDFLMTAGYLTNPPHFNTLLDPSFLK